MPNWCFTELKVECKSDAAARKLEHSIKKACKSQAEKAPYKNSWVFEDAWLGNLLVDIGYSLADIEGNNGVPYCRGRINYLERLDNFVYLNVETAWGLYLLWFKKYLDAKIPNKVRNLYFTATEENMGVYLSNDPMVAERYSVGYYPGPGEIDKVKEEELKIIFSMSEYDGFFCELDLHEKLCELLHKNKKTKIETLIKKAKEKFEGLYIMKYEYEDIEHVINL